MVESKPPNIIIIYADDLGWSDVGYNNQTILHETPNIDKIAKEGMIFNDRTFGNDRDNRRDALHCVSTNTNNFGAQSKNLASVMRGFKSAVTTFARKNRDSDFQWQSRYYDHIIRNNKSFEKIHHYIVNNPRKWEDDKFYNQ